MINLISNGLKYNDSKIPHIQIEISVEEDYYRFSVKDNGRGIAKKDLEQIFDLFHTLSETDRNDKQGTGIGLATVKKLTEKLGGQILVDSQPGEGSTFTFTPKR
jgi:signal transduction histidine kinase